jgi:hypothetical protein
MSPPEVGFSQAILEVNRSVLDAEFSHGPQRMNERYDFAALADRLDDTSEWLKSQGIAAPDRLWRYRTNIRRMMAAESRGQMEHLQQTMPEDEAREILWSYVEGDELVRALDALRPYEDAGMREQLAAAMKGPADLFLESANSNRGRNYAFELIVAGRFASAGHAPRFGGQPDVGINFGTLRIGIQCKRPLSEKGIDKNIRDALHQIDAGTDDHGIVAVSLSRIINPGDPAMMPEVEHSELGFEYLKTRLHGIANYTEKLWKDRTTPAAIGLYLYAFTPIRILTGHPRFHFYRYDVMVPICQQPTGRDRLKLLTQTMNSVQPQ